MGFDVECEQRFLEYEHEHRFSSEQQSKGNFNRRTTPGTCPHLSLIHICYDPACPLTLEMLNNTEAMCLFKTTSDAHLEEVFDAGAETNVPDEMCIRDRPCTPLPDAFRAVGASGEDNGRRL